MTVMTVMATFVGRQSEHHEVAALLEQHRVVTLVGPGGIGKTRLASELTGTAADRYDGGVLFTELAGTSDHDDIGGLVAAQHGFGSIESMRLSASSSATLVVLDNCESALRQASDVAAELVGDNSSITVLATSRAPLQIYGERIYVVTPLELPDEDLPATVRETAAARLFLDRAAAAGASWPETDENLISVGRLVRQLDGLPLAIELAAARSRMLTPPQLVEHLDRQLDLLASTGQGATARHGSLRGAIRTSYDPLPDDQKAFFRALSIFSAPFDISLAHGVAGGSDSEFDTLERLTRLVDSSLVDARASEATTTEYRLLDSIRAFGLEQLNEEGETIEVGERYTEAVLEFADQITAEALEKFSPDVLSRIGDRFVHLSHAIEWCIDQDSTAERAYRLFLPMYGPTGARSEVASLGLRMRDAWTESAPLQAEALAVLATSVFLRGDTAGATPIAEEAIAHPDGSPLAKMIGHRVLGFIAAQEGDPESATGELQAAIDLAVPFSGAFARELQASWGAVTRDSARSGEALEKLSEVLEVAAANEEMVTVLWASLAMAGHRVLLNDIEGARRRADEALAISDATGFPWSVGAAHRMLASVLVLQEGWSAGAPHFRTAFDHTLATGDIEGVVVTLRGAAGAAEHLGRGVLAQRLWGVVPAGRGRPIISSFYLDEERQLEQRHGAPSVSPISGLVEEARRLLGPAHDAVGSRAPERGASGIPAGTVTFLFTDVEGSTALWAADEKAMSVSLAQHDELIRQMIEDHDGYVFSTAGDSFAAAFDAASSAIAAAVATQEALSVVNWRGPNLLVRMGIHLGEAELRGGDYFGSVVNTAARVGNAAHGGQILLTDVARAASSPDGFDLGEHIFSGLDIAVRVWQIGEGEFPPLRGTNTGDPIPTHANILRFGDCELDQGMRELRRGGERVHIEPQVYDLLVLLIERRGTVVAKNDILDLVWGDRFVSESALTSRIKSLRKATGDDGRTQGIIRTVHGHGYSFVADVESGGRRA